MMMKKGDYCYFVHWFSFLGKEKKVVVLNLFFQILSLCVNVPQLSKKKMIKITNIAVSCFQSLVISNLPSEEMNVAFFDLYLHGGLAQQITGEVRL